MPVYFASTGPVSCQCWYRYWASTLRQYWPNAEPLLPQHWANTACRYWASTLRQHWPNAGPALAQHWGSTTCQHWPDSQPLCNVCIGPMPFIPACQYWPSTGPIHCASTGPMLDQYWPNTGAVPHASIGPIHSRCAAYALGQCRLYRPANICPVLAQYCHVCWGVR